MAQLDKCLMCTWLCRVIEKDKHDDRQRHDQGSNPYQHHVVLSDVDGTQTITHHALLNSVHAIGQLLIPPVDRLNAKPLVGICIPDGFGFAAGVVAAASVGIPFVPLDLSLPFERLLFMARGATCLLVTPSVADANGQTLRFLEQQLQPCCTTVTVATSPLIGGELPLPDGVDTSTSACQVNVVNAPRTSESSACSSDALESSLGEAFEDTLHLSATDPFSTTLTERCSPKHHHESTESLASLMSPVHHIGDREVYRQCRTCSLCGVELQRSLHMYFTSGSTARPKAVVCPEIAMVSYAHANATRHGINDSSRVLLASAITFDPSVADVWTVLCTGGVLVVPSRAELLSAPATVLDRAHITHVCTTPAVWSLVSCQPDSLPHLQVVMLGGEPMSRALCDKWAHHVRLFNVYGTTEAAVYQLSYLCSPSTPSSADPSDWLPSTDLETRLGTPLDRVYALVLQPSEPHQHPTPQSPSHSVQGNRPGTEIGMLLLLGPQISRYAHVETAAQHSVCSGGDSGMKVVHSAAMEDSGFPTSGFYPIELDISGGVMIRFTSDMMVRLPQWVASVAEEFPTCYVTGDLIAVSCSQSDLHSHLQLGAESAAGTRSFISHVPQQDGYLNCLELNPSSVLNYHGRADFQVKISGVRVNLTEVAAVLQGANLLCSTALVTFQQQRLVAHVALSASLTSRLQLTGHDCLLCDARYRQNDWIRLTVQLLLAWCRYRLPIGMVPTHIHVYATLPTSANGKLDRSRVQQHCNNCESCLELVASKATDPQQHPLSSELQVLVGCVWLEVVHPPSQLLLSSNFLSLGGESLSALRISSRLRNLLEPDIDFTHQDVRLGLIQGPFAPRNLLKFPVLEDYCRHLRKHGVTVSQSAREFIEQMFCCRNVGQHIALTPGLEGVWTQGGSRSSAKQVLSGSSCTASDDAISKSVVQGTPAQSEPDQHRKGTEEQRPDDLAAGATDGDLEEFSSEWVQAKLCKACDSSVKEATQFIVEQLAPLLESFSIDCGIKGKIRGITPLHLAARQGDAWAVEFLLEHGANVVASTRTHALPAHYAAASSADCLALLVNAGTPLRAMDINKQTLAHWAARAGQCASLRLLHSHGLSMNMFDRWFRLPLHWALLQRHIRTATALLCELESPATMKLSLYKQRKRTTLKPESPIHVAARVCGDQPQLLSTLLQHGASLEETTSEGTTLLHAAATSMPPDSNYSLEEMTGCLEFIIRQGVRTELMAAATATDTEGQTPMDLAQSVGQTAAVAILTRVLAECS
eukprot:m.292331 g.292331  ORF g.292331 m.292331 type:complete len:1268 (-) comp15838_c1_seq2:72-3875(-)